METEWLANTWMIRARASSKFCLKFSWFKFQKFSFEMLDGKRAHKVCYGFQLEAVTAIFIDMATSLSTMDTQRSNIDSFYEDYDVTLFPSPSFLL